MILVELRHGLVCPRNLLRNQRRRLAALLQQLVEVLELELLCVVAEGGLLMAIVPVCNDAGGGMATPLPFPPSAGGTAAERGLRSAYSLPLDPLAFPNVDAGSLDSVPLVVAPNLVLFPPMPFNRIRAPGIAATISGMLAGSKGCA